MKHGCKGKKNFLNDKIVLYRNVDKKSQPV